MFLTRGAGVSIKPGVERSGTPGTSVKNIPKVRGAADGPIIMVDVLYPNELSPTPRALQILWGDDPGVSLRFTPGCMLSPAPRASNVAENITTSYQHQGGGQHSSPMLLVLGLLCHLVQRGLLV